MLIYIELDDGEYNSFKKQKYIITYKLLIGKDSKQGYNDGSSGAERYKGNYEIEIAIKFRKTIKKN